MQLGIFRPPPPAVKTLMILLAVIPMLMWAAAALGYPVAPWTALDSQAVMEGQLWRPFTYIFTYPGPSLNWLFDILILWLFAGSLEGALGSSRFIRLFMVAGIAGGLGMSAQGLLASFGYAPPVVWTGADAALVGLFVAFSLLFPDDTVSILLLIMLVPIRGRYVGVIFTLITWLVGCPTSAVLASVLMTWLMVRKGIWLEGSRFQRTTKSKPKSRLQFVAPSAQKVTPIRPNPELFRQAPQEDNSEVDRILDKLRDEGMTALSPDERSTLDAHSRKLRQRDGG